MGIVLDGDVVKRSRNYFEGEEGTITKLECVDEDTVVFLSSYDGMDYREEIRFLNGNKYRLRQRLVISGTDKVIVIGKYWEEQV